MLDARRIEACPDGALFLLFGYMGVPVPLAIMAGVLVATAFTRAIDWLRRLDGAGGARR